LTHLNVGQLREAHAPNVELSTWTPAAQQTNPHTKNQEQKMSPKYKTPNPKKNKRKTNPKTKPHKTLQNQLSPPK
jgi:hypothetical protein